MSPTEPAVSHGPSLSPDGCLSLCDGSRYKKGIMWMVGRFSVCALIQISYNEDDIEVNHHSSTETSATPTGNSLISKFKPLKLKAPMLPPPKKKSTVARKMSKKRSAEKNQPQATSTAIQLGIRAYFRSQCDGPIGDQGAIDPPL